MEKIWLKEYDKGVSGEIVLEVPSLAKMLQDTAAEYPEKPAIKADGKVTNYKDFNRITEIIAGNLRLNGLERQEKVCIFLPNLKETILSFFAVVRAAFVGVMTNPLYSEDELVRQVEDSESKIMITCDALLPKVVGALPRTHLEKVFVVKLDPNTVLPDNPKIADFNDLLKDNIGYTAKNIDIENELALLQYTGGTTGISKGCMLTHKNLASNAASLKQYFAPLLKIGEESFLGVLPYFHVYGLQVSIVTPVFMAEEMVPIPRFTPKAMLMSIQNDKITTIASAPSIFSACLNQKDIGSYDLSSLKLMISGSAPLPKALREAFEARTTAAISEGYGLSEASPVTHYTPVLSKNSKQCSIGTPIPGTEVKIVDVEYGVRELGVNEDGEMCIRGPQVMKGYYKQPGQTEMVLKDGWLYTGDIAHYDEDGYSYITDRKKDLIISGGYNVYPREIEEVLFKHPKIKEVAVIGVKDQLRGEIAKAVIVLKEGETMDKLEVTNYCKEHLANYKVPRQVEFRESLPKSAVGKILKEVLKKEQQ